MYQCAEYDKRNCKDKKDKIDAPIIYTKPVVDDDATVVNHYWTKLQILPVNEFFFGENSAWLFDGYNFFDRN